MELVKINKEEALVESKKAGIRIRELIDENKNIFINSQETYNKALLVAKEVKTEGKKYKKFIEDVIYNPFKFGLRTMKALFDPHLKEIDNFEKSIKTKAVQYQQEQERIRIEKERKYQEEARKLEERERQKLEKKAIKAEEKGDIEKAEELREQKEDIFVPQPIVQSSIQKVKGVSNLTHWKFRVIDESKIKREFLTADLVKIGKLVRAMKRDAEDVIGGIEVYCEDTLGI